MDFDGSWKVSIATPIGKQSATLVISSQDGIIKGTATQGSETVNFDEPTLEGNRMTWWQTVTKPLKLRLFFDVTVEGDKMLGTVKAGKLPSSSLTGERIS